jgi:hypothetical protein
MPEKRRNTIENTKKCRLLKPKKIAHKIKETKNIVLIVNIKNGSK